MGVKNDFFQSDGKIPDWSEELKSRDKGCAKTLARDFRSEFGMLSGPVLLSTSRDERINSISSGLVRQSRILSGKGP